MVTAGAAGTLTVAASDPSGNVATGYRGAVGFTSSDPAATLPADDTFTAADNGVKSFPAGVTLYVAGDQAVTAADTVAGSLTGTAGARVNPGPVAFYYLYPDSGAVVAGQPFDVYVYPFDQFGNHLADYTGQVRFWSTDEAAVLPEPYTFRAEGGGVAYFFAGVTFYTPGFQELYVFDTETYTAVGDGLYEVQEAGGAPGSGPGAPPWADLIAALLEAEARQAPALQFTSPVREGGPTGWREG